MGCGGSKEEGPSVAELEAETAAGSVRSVASTISGSRTESTSCANP